MGLFEIDKQRVDLPAARNEKPQWVDLWAELTIRQQEAFLANRDQGVRSALLMAYLADWCVYQADGYLAPLNLETVRDLPDSLATVIQTAIDQMVVERGEAQKNGSSPALASSIS